MNNNTALTVAQPQRITDTILISEGKGLTPTNFSGLWEMSQIFAVSGMMPKELQGKPEAVFVAINMGYELGLSPLSAIQNISVINGRPTVWGDAMLAIVRASGKLTKFREYFTGTWANDDFTAVCECARGQESAQEQFSIADAKIAKLWAYPSAGVTPWHKYPKRMLQMRARSWALRNMFSDVLKGISATEEMQEFDIETQQQPDGSYAAVAMSEKRKRSKKQEQPVPVQYAPVQPSAVIDYRIEFAKLISDKSIEEQERIRNYVAEVAGKKNVADDHIMKLAAQNFERFWKSFAAWEEQLLAQEQAQAQQTPMLPEKLIKLKNDLPDEYEQSLGELGLDENNLSDDDAEMIIKRVSSLLDEQANDEMADTEEVEA